MFSYNNLLYDLINNKRSIECLDDVVGISTTMKRQFILTDIEEGTGAVVESLLRFWNAVDEQDETPVEERPPVKIYIDSPGGSLTDGFTIVDAIQLSKTPVWTICIGTAYSAGLLVFLSGHKRFAYPRSSYLLHEGSAGMGGTSSQFENFSAFYRRQLSQLKTIVLERSNITDDEYENIRKEDTWFTADDALEKGMVDEIITKFVI